jgi:hypothetical protein
MTHFCRAEAHPKPPKNLQNLPLDTPLPGWQPAARMSASKNLFSLTRVASMNEQRGKNLRPYYSYETSADHRHLLVFVAGG